MKHRLPTLSALLVVASGLYAGAAHADARLDQATAHIAKATALLETSDAKRDPGAAHRKKALAFLKYAQHEVNKAKQAVPASTNKVPVAKHTLKSGATKPSTAPKPASKAGKSAAPK